MSVPGSPNKVKRRISVIVAVLIMLAVVAVIVAKTGSTATADPAGAGAVTQPSANTGGGGPSASHADASAAYEKALASGKPIYVLFHSLTCVPCVEISAVVDRVIPTYEGKVVFVNAISDDEGTQALLKEFPFQYIPTSFFIDSKGKVVDSFTGVMDEAAMRVYLDKLAK